MRVLVTGASGFIGKSVVSALRERGDKVIAVGRSAPRLTRVFGDDVEPFEWDPNAGPLPAEALKGVDAVVNLAGESVAKGRWWRGKRRRIRDSRTNGTRHLVEGLAAADPKPAAFVSASAIGYYGDRKHNAVNEDSVPGSDFLADVCRQWEAEAVKARALGVRTAIVRIGLVLGKGGGAYPSLSRPFRFGLGGPIGLGKAWWSWVHVDDVVGLILHCVDSEKADGAYNATSPNPVPNAEFARTLGKVLKRPVIFPVPPIALRVLLGQFATVITASQKVMPLRTIGIGYEFKYPELVEALEDLR